MFLLPETGPQRFEGSGSIRLVRHRNPLLGYGVFATKFIAKGTIITRYLGRVGIAGAEDLLEDEKLYVHKMNKDFELVGRSLTPEEIKTIPMDFVGSMLNHACGMMSNCEGIVEGEGERAYVLIRATRDIYEGEECLLDYGEDYRNLYFRDPGTGEFTCLCAQHELDRLRKEKKSITQKNAYVSKARIQTLEERIAYLWKYVKAVRDVKAGRAHTHPGFPTPIGKTRRSAPPVEISVVEAIARGVRKCNVGSGSGSTSGPTRRITRNKTGKVPVWKQLIPRNRHTMDKPLSAESVESCGRKRNGASNETGAGTKLKKRVATTTEREMRAPKRNDRKSEKPTVPCTSPPNETGVGTKRSEPEVSTTERETRASKRNDRKSEKPTVPFTSPPNETGVGTKRSEPEVSTTEGEVRQLTRGARAPETLPVTYADACMPVTLPGTASSGETMNKVPPTVDEESRRGEEKRTPNPCVVTANVTGQGTKGKEPKVDKETSTGPSISVAVSSSRKTNHSPPTRVNDSLARMRRSDYNCPPTEEGDIPHIVPVCNCDPKLVGWLQEVKQQIKADAAKRGLYNDRGDNIATRLLLLHSRGYVYLTFGMTNTEALHRKIPMGVIHTKFTEYVVVSIKATHGTSWKTICAELSKGMTQDNMTQCFRNWGIVPAKRPPRVKSSWLNPIHDTWEYSSEAVRERIRQMRDQNERQSGIRAQRVHNAQMRLQGLGPEGAAAQGPGVSAPAGGPNVNVNVSAGVENVNVSVGVEGTNVNVSVSAAGQNASLSVPPCVTPLNPEMVARMPMFMGAAMGVPMFPYPNTGGWGGAGA